MVTMVVHHPVRAYDAWKPVFDEHEPVRRAHGEVEHRIYRFPDAPDSVVIHNDFASLDAARRFMADPSLPEAMARAGVIGQPGMGFLELTDRTVYADAPDVGPAILVVHHRVVDAGAWKAAFDEHEPLRRAAGALEHRVFQDRPSRTASSSTWTSRRRRRRRRSRPIPTLPAVMERAGVLGKPGIGLARLGERKVYAAAPPETAESPFGGTAFGITHPMQFG